jgi:glycosyltransferase involved in cell wall biosynthesis
MITASLIFFLIVLCAALIQGVFAICFTAMLRRGSASPSGDEELPKAAVLLALRGADPFLRQSLEGLLAQHYPDYRIVIVVDNARDAACELVEKIRAANPSGRIEWMVLDERLESCSLKNSALIQAIGRLDPSIEVLAFFDGDVVPHADWLACLVRPLADRRIGAVTGNRWYMPAAGAFGSLARYAWNVAAIVQMWFNNIVWAGSMALRRDVVESGLLDVWRRSMTTDSVVYPFLRTKGLRVAFSVEDIMVNREEISLVSFTRWLCRQVLMVRLYHPGWSMVVLQTLFVAGLHAAAVGLVLVAVLLGDFTAAAWALSAVALYWTSSLAYIWLVEGGVRVQIARRGEPTRWLPWWRIPKLAAAMVAANFVFPIAVLRALWMPNVVWRGISYRIRGPFQVERGKYTPFATRADRAKSTSIV